MVTVCKWCLRSRFSANGHLQGRTGRRVRQAGRRAGRRQEGQGRAGQRSAGQGSKGRAGQGRERLMPTKK